MNPHPIETDYVLQSHPMTCPFCNIEASRIVVENDTAVAIQDNYPVNLGHVLVIPRRHVPTWFDASKEEQGALMELVDRVKVELDKEFQPAGYNIGINVGTDAGQMVMHLHVHVIPRYKGDVDDPTGGVRYVIPERGNYKRPGRIAKARTE